MRGILVLLLLCVWEMMPTARADDALQTMAGFASIPALSTGALLGGEIRVQVNASMKLARGVSAQACCFIPASLDHVAAILPKWEARLHPELEIYQHVFFQNEREADFDALRFDVSVAPFRRLLDLMGKPGGVQLSPAELAAMPASPTPTNARIFWSNTLRSRWKAFGGAGLKPQALPGSFDTRAELRQLLAEEPKVEQRFGALLAETPLILDAPGLPVTCYWDVTPVNKTASLSVGAVYRKGRQFADILFYVSNGYLASINLYELFPFSAGGREGVLLWQGNFVSSGQLTGGFGLKRKLAAKAIEGDTRESIRFFQKDAASP